MASRACALLRRRSACAGHSEEDTRGDLSNRNGERGRFSRGERARARERGRKSISRETSAMRQHQPKSISQGASAESIKRERNRGPSFFTTRW